MRRVLLVALLLIAGCSDHQFTSCVEASEAGAPLPLHQGDVGWNPKLDADGDGVACE